MLSFLNYAPVRQLNSVWAGSISRRLVFVVVACWSAISTANSQTLDARLGPLVTSHAGKVSIVIEHLGSGEKYQYRADEIMPTASLIKLPLMVSTFGKFHRHELVREQMLTLDADDKVPGSGILTAHFSAGTQISLLDAVHLMMVYSDNTATNLVARATGLEQVRKDMHDLGLPNTSMNSPAYRRDQSIAPEQSAKYGLGNTTAAEIVSLLAKIERHQIFTAEICEEMKSHMLACEDKTKLVRFLPPKIKVAHKSGEISAARCEAGIIFGQSGPIAICVMTAENEDKDFYDDHPAHVLIGRVAEEAWLHFNPPGTATQESESTLHVGSGGWRVENLQRTLNARAVPSPKLSVDGDFGLATEAAVKDFQKRVGLQPTGIVDQRVWERLGPIVPEAAIAEPSVVNAESWPTAIADTPHRPPLVSATSWAAVDAKTGAWLGGEAADMSRPIASTTKIMTAWLVLKLAAGDPSVLHQRVTFSWKAASTEGSSARLSMGESVTTDELLYGLLLPSGNDAAVALAEHFGPQLSLEEVTDKASGEEHFVAMMNAEARRLGLDSTHFANPHGLPDPAALSSARDLSRLATLAMRDENFRRYVSTPKYGCQVLGPDGNTRNHRWDTTNQLLGIDGYIGIKTGTTRAAGACLVASGQFENRECIVVVLGCSDSDARYRDARNLMFWAWQQSN
ncbi:MAG: serine hydrolase [Planctomycetales bacterium]|nr:serine hydrolase [Planctomycetales bacterium]